jgi:dipeptidyl aminopeptidase/acylaminoacyl peptidase
MGAPPGAPPWAELDRYQRNGAISFADRVTTPMMTIQGDEDYVPIQQCEELFTPLFRQNKPALFVRY